MDCRETDGPFARLRVIGFAVNNVKNAGGVHCKSYGRIVNEYRNSDTYRIDCIVFVHSGNRVGREMTMKRYQVVQVILSMAGGICGPNEKTIRTVETWESAIETVQQYRKLFSDVILAIREIEVKYPDCSKVLNPLCRVCL